MAAPTDPQAGRVLPDVADPARTPFPADSNPLGDAPQVGEGLLQDVIPEIARLAQRVGGFKRLAELAAELDRAGPVTPSASAERNLPEGAPFHRGDLVRYVGGRGTEPGVLLVAGMVGCVLRGPEDRPAFADGQSHPSYEVMFGGNPAWVWARCLERQGTPTRQGRRP